MPLTNSWPGVNGAATTTEARQNIAGLIARDAAGNARSGVLPAHANALVSARADMNVDIASFVGAAVQFGGPILIANVGVAQLPAVLVAPGAGTNYYVVYGKQNESAPPGTDAGTTRVFGAQLSTTSFAVARAALPAGALELATVEMPTGKTATNQAGVVITQTHQYTAPLGSPVWMRNTTERDAWSVAQGAKILRLDRGWEEAYFAAWNSSTNPAGATPAGWYPVSGGPEFIAEDLGTTSVASGASFVSLNTGLGSATVWRNDGFTTGVGSIGAAVPGLYDMQGTIQFPSSSAGSFRGVQIVSDVATAEAALAQPSYTLGSGFMYIPFAGTIAVGSNFSIQVRHDIGSAQNVILRMLSAKYAGVRRH